MRPLTRSVAFVLAVSALTLTACKNTAKQPLGTDTALVKTDTNLQPAARAGIPKNGGDTIAVPADAIDTTTNRAAGQAAGGTNANGKAVGVDTPITRRMGSPARARP